MDQEDTDSHFVGIKRGRYRIMTRYRTHGDADAQAPLLPVWFSIGSLKLGASPATFRRALNHRWRAGIKAGCLDRRDQRGAQCPECLRWARYLPFLLDLEDGDFNGSTRRLFQAPGHRCYHPLHLQTFTGEPDGISHPGAYRSRHWHRRDEDGLAERAGGQEAVGKYMAGGGVMFLLEV